MILLAGVRGLRVARVGQFPVPPQVPSTFSPIDAVLLGGGSWQVKALRASSDQIHGEGKT